MFQSTSDRIFFTGTALFFLLTNVIGFTSTVNSRIASDGSMAGHIYIHGICAGIWILLYLVQCLLIAGNRKRWHRSLGKAGGIVLAAVLISGFYVAFKVPSLYGPLEESSMIQPGRDFAMILMSVIFAILGIRFRHTFYVHKRLMMFATLLLSSAGIARTLGAIGLGGNIPFIISTLFLPVVALIIYDWFTYRKFFKVHLIGIVSILLIFVLAAPFLWENPVMQPVLYSISEWLS